MTAKTKRKSLSPTFNIEENALLKEEPFTPTSGEVTPSPAPLPWLTIETLLYGLLFMLALALRLWRLDGYPLSSSEASQSLLAWQLYQGNPLEGGGYSPLLVTLNALTFLLLGPSDTTARLASVFLGCGLVLLPLTFRRQLGPTACVVATALLAISPTAVFLSRTVNSEMGVATGALMVVSGLFNWAADGRQRWLWLAATGLALLLTAGPIAYSALLVLGIIFLIRRSAFQALWRRGTYFAQTNNPEPSPPENEHSAPQSAAPAESRRGDDDGTAASSPPSLQRPASLFPISSIFYVFLGCLVLLATTATFNLSGLSAVSSLLTDWLSRFSFQNRPEAGFNGVFLLTIYEPVLVLTGLAGLAFAILERDLLRETLGGWFVGVIFLDILMGGRPVGSVILPLVPLAFLSALALAELWHGLQQEGSWGNEGLLLAAGLVIGTFAYIGLTAWLIRTCDPNDNICQYGWVQPLAALVLFIIIAVFFWFMTDAAVATRGAALAGVVLGVLFALSIGWRLNYGPLMDLTYQPLAGIPASTELVALTDTLTRTSAQRAGGQLTALDTTLVNVNSPALLWRLRDFDSLARVSSLVGAQPTSAIITPTGGELGLSTPYLGQGFALDAVWSPVGMAPKELLKWLLFRHVATRPQGNQAILWLQVAEN